MQVTKASLPLLKHPGGPLETELLFGELFEIDAVHLGHYSGSTVIDSYRGYIPNKGVREHALIPTHRVHAICAHAYSMPDFKSPRRMSLFMNSLVHVEDSKHTVLQTPEGNMRLVEGAGWLFEKHLTPIAQFAHDHVSLAECYLGAPYLWGGRTYVGFDCSGLTQAVFLACGIVLPRNSGDQEVCPIGASVPVVENLEGLARGDLVFFKGHVGIMTVPKRILHATADHMAVVEEGIWSVVERRLARGESGITSIKRI